MKCVQIIGYKGCGKSSLIRGLSSVLNQKGYSVTVVKHACHDLHIPAKDESMLESADRYMVVSDRASVFYQPQFLPMLKCVSYAHTDVLLAEGFKDQYYMPRIACFNTEEEKDLLTEGCELAYWGPRDRESNERLEELAGLVESKGFLLAGLNCKACGHDTCKELLRAILQGEKSLSDCNVIEEKSTVEIDGRPVHLSPFVAEIMKETFSGFLRSLKGVTPGRVRLEFDLDC